MAGRKPKWQIFRKTKGQKVNYKEDQIGALWAEENQYGEYFTGKVGDTFVVVYKNKFYDEAQDGPQDQRGGNGDYGVTATNPDDEDVPF